MEFILVFFFCVAIVNIVQGTEHRMLWSCIAKPNIEDDLSRTDATLEDERLFEVGQTHYFNGYAPENAIKVKVPFLSECQAGYFALFEGHRNGYVVSHTVSNLLHDFLQKEILLDESSGLDIRLCFESAYSKADDRVKTIAADRGTSAAAWIIRKCENKLRLHFSNVGGSRAVLCRGTTTVRLTDEHVPSNVDERRRLESTSAYANSCSGVRQLVPTTRAIGDHLLKGWVISRPHYSTYDLSPEDTFIVCMTSNISQLINDEEVLALSAGESAQGLSDCLVAEAADRGAQGCLSALVVRLDWHADSSRGSRLSRGGSWRSLGRQSLRSSASSSRSSSVMTSSSTLGSGSWFGSWLEG